MPPSALEDALAFCRRAGVWCNVEIKPAPGHEAETGRAVARVAAAFEPVVQECGTSYQLRGLSARYQLSFDLNWQQGYR